MYIKRSIEAKIILMFSWKELIMFLLLALGAYFAYVKFKLTMIAIPFLPVATIGTAVAFYVGFKNNASYERLWEARKIWAEIEHLCRFLGILVLTSKQSESQSLSASNLRNELIARQIAWVNVLRLQLRSRPTFHDAEIGDQTHVKIANAGVIAENDGGKQCEAVLREFTSESELTALSTKRFIAVELLRNQIRGLEKIKDDIGSDIYGKCVDIIEKCSQQQSAAERINSFPFPRQYAHFSSFFINIFNVLLPFSLIGEFSKIDPAITWLSVPFSVLISWIFYTMEKVGETSENPFENGLNDVPLSSICRDIEIELKEMLGQKDLPEKIQSQDFILL